MKFATKLIRHVYMLLHCRPTYCLLIEMEIKYDDDDDDDT